jgi:hypothetical protein
MAGPLPARSMAMAAIMSANSRVNVAKALVDFIANLAVSLVSVIRFAP